MMSTISNKQLALALVTRGIEVEKKKLIAEIDDPRTPRSLEMLGRIEKKLLALLENSDHENKEEMDDLAQAIFRGFYDYCASSRSSSTNTDILKELILVMVAKHED